MGYIEVYRGILRYETGIYPTIPNFIFFQISFIFNTFLTLRDGFYTILFKCLHSLDQRSLCCADIEISYGLDHGTTVKQVSTFLSLNFPHKLYASFRQKGVGTVQSLYCTGPFFSIEKKENAIGFTIFLGDGVYTISTPFCSNACTALTRESFVTWT